MGNYYIIKAFNDLNVRWNRTVLSRNVVQGKKAKNKAKRLRASLNQSIGYQNLDGASMKGEE